MESQTATAQVINNPMIGLIKFEKLTIMNKVSSILSPKVDASFIREGAQVELNLRATGGTYTASTGIPTFVLTLKLGGFLVDEVDITAILVRNSSKLRIVPFFASSSVLLTTDYLYASDHPHAPLYDEFGLDCFFAVKDVDGMAEQEVHRPLPLGDAFERGRGNDAAFVIDGKKIGFAKFVLINSSQVFEVMFADKWLNARNGEISIEGTDYQTMYKFVKSLYTRRFESDNVFDAFDLYMLADKYDVEFVKQDALKYISRNLKDEGVETAQELFRTAHHFNIESILKVSAKITDENLLEIFQMAEEHNYVQVRKSALDYFAKIRGRENFQNLPSYRELGIALMRLMLKRIDE